MRPIYSLIFAAIIWIAPGYGTATAQDTTASDFDSFRESYTGDLDRYRNVMASGVAASRQEYDAYRETLAEEFRRFRERMLQQWGSFKERSRKEWVEYRDGGDTRIEVDFETGQGSVEVLVDDPGDVEQATGGMPQKVLEAINASGTELGFEPETIPNRPVTEEPVLENQLDKQPGESDRQFAQRMADSNVTTREVTGEDGLSRTVVTVNFRLAPNHIQTRAQKVSGHVYDFAQQYELAPSLVFAIIHTESFFNPVASSPANAFGLMQLVPTSGGRDAYRAVYKKDGIPTKNFLFDPGNNVNLGCAYIDILSNRYLAGIRSPKSRTYAVISAYNTGAGNVFRAYDSGSRKKQALRKINSMSDSENYDHLAAHLPYKETRDYLEKVTERSRKYEDWSR